MVPYLIFLLLWTWRRFHLEGNWWKFSSKNNPLASKCAKSAWHSKKNPQNHLPLDGSEELAGGEVILAYLKQRRFFFTPRQWRVCRVWTWKGQSKASWRNVKCSLSLRELRLDTLIVNNYTITRLLDYMWYALLHCFVMSRFCILLLFSPVKTPLGDLW